ncbi:carbohydrate sulfotransferase 15-like [Amphiura filiformis]|uniref:carbohydrate sulfotransferase 15-like n=1 Tax=Amphiura filiformis TaxID=82378 RepID=UPI003B2214B0
MATHLCAQLFKYRRRLAVLIFSSALVSFIYTNLKLKGYEVTIFNKRSKLSGQSPWQHTSTKLEHLEIHRQLDWNYLSTNNKTKVERERDKSDLFNQSQNLTSLLNINFRNDKLKLANGVKDHAVKSLELKKMLQQFEAWKRKHADVLNNRNVPLELPPPPHVNDKYLWDEMLTTFPLVFRRLMKPFLIDYKNPCFRQKDLRCLPYFIEIGAAKCGTTDLYYHISRHPQVVRVYKEPHFWTHMDKSDNSITKYLNSLKKFTQSLVTQRDNESLIFGDGSPSYIWENNELPRNKNGELIFLWADVIHAVMPGAKIILILRNPTDRTISDYFYSGLHQSPTDFHRHVQVATKRFNKCRLRRSYRECATRYYYPRIHVSVYIAHVREWLRLYPREQFLVLRNEDWHDHANNSILQTIFKFLEIDELSEADLPDLEDDRVLVQIESKKATERKSQKLGYVLPKTRALLDTFLKDITEN